MEYTSEDFTAIKLEKLKKMKLIATSLLILNGIIYVICKKYKIDQSSNLFYSSIAAFAEASIVGGFADWFAVVALFKHPLGIKSIPHTAIIKKNKNEIGDSLANFVVNNFLDDEQIKEKINDVQISGNEFVDTIARKGLLGFILSKKDYLGKHISETVKGWNDDDIVEKLESQVGSDLQYIRMNGTIVGGLIGVILHLITHFI